ncbi:hypothetical protein DET0647 [Dehalococcoides mccartyi 195]|uniref:Uncharacterized protein n=1 Tax=Dehalococcoides mccartyi (strain ATCC BAA-2266 / KCTC 15142 / 195) TaxID=243164 RepID=Q3Z8M6_DEHM1|nr:hypothetical protein DET0681 [Dehalococcoides mccartyi 195]AAW40119.1 hypothetical protein DET0647 [Dehalococcoides mccartyi 195]
MQLYILKPYKREASVMIKPTKLIPPFPQMTIGVMGSAGGAMSDETKKIYVVWVSA